MCHNPFPLGVLNHHAHDISNLDICVSRWRLREEDEQGHSGHWDRVEDFKNVWMPLDGLQSAALERELNPPNS